MAVYTSQNNYQPIKKHTLGFKVGTALICVSIVFLINLIFNIVTFVNSFLLGAFGLFSYALLIGFVIYGIMLIKDKKISLSPVDVILLILWLTNFLLIIHVATSSKFLELTFGEYIAKCYSSKQTCGGVVLSILTYPFKAIFSHVVAVYSIMSVLLILISSAIVVRSVKYKNEFLNSIKSKQNSVKIESHLNAEQNNPKNKTEVPTSHKETNPLHKQNLDDLIIPDSDVDNIKNNTQIELSANNENKEKAKNILGLSNQSEKPQNTKSVMENFDAKISKYEETNSSKPQKIVHSEPAQVINRDKKLSDKDKENLKYLHEIIGYSNKQPTQNTTNVSAQQKLFGTTNDNNDLYDENLTINNYKQSLSQPTSYQKSTLFESEEVLLNNSTQKHTSLDKNQNFNTQQNKPMVNLEEFDEVIMPNINKTTTVDVNFDEDFEVKKPEVRQEFSKPQEKKPEYKQEVLQPFEIKKSEPPKKIYKKPSNYVRPDVSLLSFENGASSTNEDYSDQARILEETLESFNAPAKVVSIVKGPAFTRFELQMQQGIPVKRVNALVDDIAMTLRARGDIRMEIPVPGKNAFGVEIPNEKIDTVSLREIVESYNFQSSKSPLTFALGKDITGEAKVARIDKMPHLLVGGATGSGKSVCLNTMLISLLYKASPDELKLILIDPKRVEFTPYNGLPHMLLPKAITDVDNAVKALDWLIKEMDRRYNRFAEVVVRNIDEFNNRSEIISQIEPKMPYIVFIVDELGDLMLQRKKDVEEKIIRLTQLSRAAGIYLVIATQRPSVDVVTGTIKANLPSRIAFAVSGFPDSKTILDQGGAEKLLGMGDMLYSPNGSIDLLRIQGAFVHPNDVNKIVDFIKQNNECEFDSEIEDEMFNTDKNAFSADGGGSQEFDPLLKESLRLFIKQQNASISKLQRAFGIGFPRAAKIVDQMEAAGFVGPKDNKNLRPLYITQQEFEERFGEDL